jgi:hypothetical protein
MQLQRIPQSIFNVEPPPLWLVTNGEITVGPVVTGLLKKGVEYGRVPEYCHVRALRGDWRKLEAVREIAALTSKVSAVFSPPATDELIELEHSAQRVRDEDHLFYGLTQLSLTVTGAECAMFHYRERFTRSLATRCVLGPISSERLGRPLSELDLVLRAARRGQPVVGPPFGLVENALTLRFAGSSGGTAAVAMIPFFVDGSLLAMLELSRPGHAFRRSDLRRAERLVQRGLWSRVN